MGSLLLLGAGGKAAAPGAILDGTSPNGAWSFSRDLLTTWGAAARYTENTGKIDALKDQSGNSRDLLQTTAARRPVIGTGAPNTITCGVFNSTDLTYLTTAAGDPLSDFIAAGAGWIVISFIGSTIDTNSATVYLNEGLVCDTGQFMGLFLKTGDAIHVYNWDGSVDTTSTAVTEGAAYVAEWRHEGGNVYCRLNGSTEVSAASGNTTTLTGLLRIGAGPTAGGSTHALDGMIFEMAAYSTVPAVGTRDAIVADFMDHLGI